MRPETGPAIELEKVEGSMEATILKACKVCNVRNIHYAPIVILLYDTNAPPSCAGARRGKVEGTGGVGAIFEPAVGRCTSRWFSPHVAESHGCRRFHGVVGNGRPHCYCVRLGRVQIIQMVWMLIVTSKMV